MAKQLNVNVAVTADTSAAKAQLDQLQKTLQQLTSNSSNLKLNLNTAEIQKANSAINELGMHLKVATNVNTGALDFSKLNASLTRGKTSLADYGAQLLKLGPQGQSAFDQLTQAVIRSEVPVKRLSTLFGQFGTVIMNTVKWQAASSMIHGFMGSIQHAYNYAQQLDASLNRIQIVTQASNEQMAKFAENANKAAQRLSTTTTRYTDASLIYYQQGLSDKEVAARTETTIKLANVSGQSAQKVSDQMTAIWNNFDNGTKSLESYADVITALGAATASSSEEIATGLQKFAAVANTVGLSYENATAALATITATTRQSADTVGTGLRTLFSRLQSLSLGDTLEDGVTLTKYSKALDKIGVQVLDYTGNLRSADDILLDMGEKWQSLTDAQKTAVAQTVGGVRQYATIMALMDNFDVYQNNIKIAQNSEGTVEKQFATYEKSWEASKKRVQAATEEIYNSLIDENFFKGFNNLTTGFLKSINLIIDSLGGLKGVLASIGVLATTVFKNQFASGLNKIVTGFQYLSTSSTELNNKKSEIVNQLVDMRINPNASDDTVEKQKLYYRQQIEASNYYNENRKQMDAIDQARFGMYQDRIQQAQLNYAAAIEKSAKAEDLRSDTQNDLYQEAKKQAKAIKSANQFVGKNEKTLTNQEWQQYQRYKNQGLLKNRDGQITALYSQEALKAAGMTSLQFNKTFGDDFKQLTKDITNREIDPSSIEKGIREAISSINKDTTLTSEKQKADALASRLGITDKNLYGNDFFRQPFMSVPGKGVGAISDMAKTISETNADQQATQIAALAEKYNMSEAAIEGYIEKVRQKIAISQEEITTEEALKQVLKEEEQERERVAQSMQKAQQFTAVTSGIMSFGMALSQVTSLMKQWNQVIETGEGSTQALLSTLIAMPMALMSLTTALTSIGKAFSIAGLAEGGLAGPWAAGILAAIVAIGLLIKAIDNVIETPKEKLERLKQEAEEAQTAADEAKQAYDNFLNNQNSRNALLSEIEKLTKGTQEYINKVQEANAISQEMINGQHLTYGTDYWYDDDNILQITENAQKQIAENLNNRNISAAHEAAYAQLQFENEEARGEQERRERYDSYAKNNISTGFNSITTNAKWNFNYKTALGGLSNNDIDALAKTGALDDAKFYAYAKAIGTTGNNPAEILGNLIESLLATPLDEIDNLTSIEKEIYERAKQLSDQTEGFSSIDLGRYIADTAEENLNGYNLNLETAAAGLAKTYTNVPGSVGIGFNEQGEILGSETILENQIASAQALNTMLPTFESMMVQMIGENRQQKDYSGNKIAESTAMEALLDNFSNLFIDLQQRDNEIKSMSEEDLADFIETDAGKKYGGSYYRNTDGSLNYDLIKSAYAADEIWSIISQKLQTEQNKYQNTGGYDWNNIDSWLSKDILNTIINNPNIDDIYEQAAQNNYEQAQQDVYDTLTKNLKELGEEFTIDNFLQDFMSNDKTNFSSFTLEQLSKLSQLSNTLSGFGSGTVLEMLKGVNTENLDKLSNIFSGGSTLQSLYNGIAEARRSGDELIKSISEKAIEEFGGETGILSKIFGEEDFQKELKKVQKEFKKTGKISTKNVDDIADSCEDLNEALDLNILSAGAVADAIDLYSIGAISSIEDISEELWAALEAANAFEDSLRNAFNYIDNWSPDRSITDLDDFFSKVSKDYFEELKQGTTGSTRLYQDAEALWGKQYSQNLRRFFFDQETGQGTMDNPQARAANYQKTFGEFDQVWENVQKQGNLLPYWNFLLGSTGNTAANINQQLYGSSKGQVYNAGSNISSTIVNKTGMESGKEYTVSEALGFLGLSQGKNNGDIEFTDYGLTTDEMRQGIKSVLGLNDDQADAYLQEMSGHSQFMATALQSNDLQAGYDTLIGKYKDKGIHYNEYNGQMTGSDNNGHEYADYGAMADMQNYALANRDFLDYYSKLGKDLETKHDNGTLTAEEEKQYETWVRNRDAINNLNDSVEKYDASVQQLNDSYDKHIETTDNVSEALKEAWSDESLSEEQKARLKASASGAVVGQGETGTKEEGKDIYDVEGMLEHTKNLLGAKADDMSPEELWEAAAQQAENYGGVLGTKLTNAYGEVKDVTREAGESQEDYNKRLQEAKNDLKSSENKQLGKDLFQGIVDAIKELDPATLNEQIKPVIETINELAQAFASLDGSAESIQALTTAFNELAKLPTIFGDGSTVENLQNLVITLDKINGTEFKLDISTSLSPNEISHLAKDFDDMYAKKNIEISIKIIDDASVQQFKGDKQGIKSTLEALNKAAQINLKINGLETLGQQVKAAIDEINMTHPTIHVKLDKDQPGDQQGDKGPSEKPNSSRSTTNSDTKAPSAHSGASKSTVQTEIKSTAKITKADASAIEPVEIKAEPQFSKKGSQNQSMKIQVLPVVEEEALEEIAKPVNKDVTLNKHSEEIDNYIAEVPSKTVNLLVGLNEPQAAIDALPTSHTLDMSVNVTVGITSAFGSMTLAGGAGIIGAMGPSIQAVASGAALTDPRTQAAIEGVRKHYTKGKAGCQYSEGTCRDGGPTGGTATGSTIYHSYVNGSANRYSKPGISLTAEEGPEIVWNKQEGYAYIVGGEGHPEFTVLRPGDRIFNANDTRQILNYNRPKSNHSSEVKDPREMDDALFSSHAPGGSIYGSYGPQSTYRSSRGKSSGRSGDGEDKYERKKFYEPERYHLLTRQIEDLTFQYNELKKVRDRAYGTNVLKAIDAEIAKVDELKNHNQLLLEEAENYLEKDRALLDELGIEYELDNEGNLANFEELQDQYKKLLELQEDANGEKIEDEQLDELQERWNAIEKYEETLDKIRDIKEEISDLKYEAEDLAFEKIELEFDMKLNFTDRQLSLIDHFLEKLKGNTADAAEMLAIASQKMDLLAQNAQTATEKINSVFIDPETKEHLMVTDDTTGEQRDMTYQDFLDMTPEERTALNISEDAGSIIESSMDKIQQCLEDLEELKTVGLETVSQAIEELTANVEKQIQVFDHYSNMLSALRNITDLQGIKITKELRQTLKQIDESMIQVSKDRITAEKEKYDGLSKMAEDLRKKVQQYAGVDEDLRKGYQEQLDNIEGQMRESMETVLSMYQNALQTAKDMFEATMDEIKEDYNASLSDIYNTTQLMQEAFDRKTAISEQYVDEYESYYKLNKLQRQINKDIDNQMANGNRANKNLKKLLNEIQKLQEDGIQLTAYDLELLEKKYEYEKALADLEDARNAKQTIRLQRDRNGNWGYVYTAADETDLEEYQQTIEDKLYEYTQTATQQAKDLEKELLSIWVETGEKIAQLRMEGAPSSAINDLIDDTQKRADFLTESLKKAGEDINYVLPNWIDLTQNEQFDLSLDDFKETVLSYVTGIEDVEAVSQKMMKAIINIAKETKMAVDTYNASIEEINAFVSGGTGDFNASAQTWAAQITKASQENVEKTKEAVDDMVDTFRDVLKEASAFENKFFNEIKPFIQQQEQILIQLTDAMSQLNGLPSNLQNLQDAAALANGQAKATSYIDENGHTQTQITHLDEGGYTGEWGPGGKLAVLHEKENVFNKKDTINLLKAANILRTLDIQTGNFERGLGEFFNPSVKDNKQTLEQEVYITAEFPNATNHSEIEEAFNNLANRATQYANRKVG